MRSRQTSVIFPLVLVAIGVVFLLDNANLLAVGAWDLLWRLWPLILVAWGLQGLFGRRPFGALLVIVLTVGLAVGIVWYSVNTGLIHASPLPSAPISQSLGQAHDADVSIDLNVGSLSISALNDPSLLLEGTVTEGSATQGEGVRMEGDTAHFSLNDEGISFLRGEVRWQLGLTDSIPLDLYISNSVGDSMIDLSELDIRTMSFDSGVGAATITVPGSGRPRIRIDQGIGFLRVNVPLHVEARIRIDGGLGSIQIDSRFREVGDDIFETEGYRTAVERVEIDIDRGVGEVVIP